MGKDRCVGEAAEPLGEAEDLEREAVDDARRALAVWGQPILLGKDQWCVFGTGIQREDT